MLIVLALATIVGMIEMTTAAVNRMWPKPVTQKGKSKGKGKGKAKGKGKKGGK